MALRCSEIKNFDDLWCLGALGGLEFCVSSVNFQKSNIGWPQQPPIYFTHFNMRHLASELCFKVRWSKKWQCMDIIKC